MDTFVLAHTYAYMAHTQSGGSLGIDISYDLALALEIQSGNNQRVKGEMGSGCMEWGWGWPGEDNMNTVMNMWLRKRQGD